MNKSNKSSSSTRRNTNLSSRLNKFWRICMRNRWNSKKIMINWPGNAISKKIEINKGFSVRRKLRRMFRKLVRNWERWMSSMMKRLTYFRLKRREYRSFNQRLLSYRRKNISCHIKVHLSWFRDLNEKGYGT